MHYPLMAPALLLLTSFVFLLVNLSQSSLHEQRLPYMTSDVEDVSGRSFDYIIVGGGTAGCPLAATLSQRFKVLLVERGGSPYGNPSIWNKAYFGAALLQTDDFSSVAQSFVSEDGVPSHRGRVLGGTSAINFAFYSRASADSVKRNRWDKELVKEAYEWIESKIVFKPELTMWQSVVKNGLIEAGFVPYNGFTWEHIVGTKIGGSIYDNFGIRHTSADLLRAGNSENIAVLLNATVKSIIFREDGNEKVAYGIRFIKSNSSDNQIYEVHLNRRDECSSGGDVILAAGALGSPQMLMLSGIGPAEHLKKFDIPLVLDLQGVGRQMQDNPALSIFADAKQGYRLPDSGQVAGIAKEFKFISEGGIIPTNLNATSTRRLISIKLAFPESTGKLRLNSTDPRKNPSVKFNYLTTENDLDNCVKMARVLLRVSRSQSVAPYFGTEAEKKPISRPEELRDFCKKNVRTYYHYHGGCNVGSVVDDDYKVYGVKGLRVIDGSTFSESPGTNPMATVLMLGRYQGIKILKENEPTYLFDGPKQP